MSELRDQREFMEPDVNRSTTFWPAETKNYISLSVSREKRERER